jgi:hypothetical protein
MRDPRSTIETQRAVVRKPLCYRVFSTIAGRDDRGEGGPGFRSLPYARGAVRGA